MTVLDLFSGLGGFSCAASWADMTVLAQVEIDERCREFLGRRWPETEQHGDIREFDGKPFRGRTDIVCGGPPCQPVSVAGKRRGADDDRWLWGEALRVVAEVESSWIVLENPPGIAGMGLSGILAELASLGYEVRVLGIPACAVGAPHRRNRYWIVGHSASAGRVRASEHEDDGADRAGWWRRDATDADESRMGHAEKCERRNDECRALRPTWTDESRVADAAECGRDAGTRGPGGVHAGRPRAEAGINDATGGMADANIPRRQGADTEPRTLGLRAEHRQGDVADGQSVNDEWPERSGDRGRQSEASSGDGGGWSRYVWLPCADGKVRRAPDDTQRMAHGLPVELSEGLAEGEVSEAPHRSLIAALGNAIVPQVAYCIFESIKEVEE